MIVTINGRDLTAGPEESLLDVARRNGIDIPTLCAHEGLELWGGCRLCVVELSRGPDGPARIVPSCLQPAEDGVRVETHTKRVQDIRATLVDLLLARAPASERMQALAREYGLRRTSFVPRANPDRCILCDLCVRTCAAVGPRAISTAGRGAIGVISLPFKDDARDCIGCGACALTCPTGAIPMVDRGSTREIWGRTFQRVRCGACGQPTVTREHAAHLAGRSKLPEDSLGTCDACRRVEISRRMTALVDLGGRS